MKDFNLDDGQLETLRRINVVVDEIEAKGISLTDRYEDWVSIGMGIAHDFGEAGRDIFYRVSRTYPGYDEKEAERKYDNFLKSPATGNSATCATLFYLAKQAGVVVNDTARAGAEPTIRSSHSLRYAPDGRYDTLRSAPLRDTLDDGGINGNESENEEDQMERIPEWIFGRLPEMLREPVMRGRTVEEREMLLLGSIVAYSAAVPMYYGVYGDKRVSANLFLYVTGEASAGKGVLEFCKKLINRVHIAELKVTAKQMQEFREKTAYYNSNKKKEEMEEPKMPKQRMLIMPANTTATSLYQHLAENNKGLIMIDTEGDTMLQAFKNDKGNYSEGLRKVFHHEEISYSRRTDNEYVSCSRPRLSVILSGTPMQALNLFPSTENGLFSRFMFYALPMNKREWKNMLNKSKDSTMEEVFDAAGKKFHEMYQGMMADGVLYHFSLSDSQAERFNAYFSEAKPAFIDIYDTDISASIHRAGLMAFRMAMVLTALRSMESGVRETPVETVAVQETFLNFGGGEIPFTGSAEKTEELRREAVCSDDDFEVAMEIMKVVILHIARMFMQIPKSQADYKKLYKERYKTWFEKLPEEFDFDTAVKTGKMCNISKSSVSRMLKRLAEAGEVTHDLRELYKKKRRI